jgi:hypothetical protein
VYSRIQNLLRGCLLSYGVTRNGKLAVVESNPTSVSISNADDTQLDDADDQLTAWEQDRASTLQDAEESEQQGLRHLTKAALLRLVVHFEDEGMFDVAHELRQQADAFDGKLTCCVQPLGEPTF